MYIKQYVNKIAFSAFHWNKLCARRFVSCITLSLSILFQIKVTTIGCKPSTSIRKLDPLRFTQVRQTVTFFDFLWILYFFPCLYFILSAHNIRPFDVRFLDTQCTREQTSSRIAKLQVQYSKSDFNVNTTI